MLVSPVFWPPHLRQDEPPGWDGEKRSSDRATPRETAPGPCSLPVPVSLLASLLAVKASCRPSFSTEAALFPARLPACSESAGVGFTDQAGAVELALGRGPRPGSAPGSWPGSPRPDRRVCTRTGPWDGTGNPSSDQTADRETAAGPCSLPVLRLICDPYPSACPPFPPPPRALFFSCLSGIRPRRLRARTGNRQQRS